MSAVSKIQERERPMMRTLNVILFAIFSLVNAHAAFSIEDGKREYQVIRQGDVIGSMVISRSDNNLSSHYQYSNNGRGPDIKFHAKVDSMLFPTTFEIEGLSLLQTPVRESATYKDGVLEWRSGIDSGESAKRAFYFPTHSTPAHLEMLAGALLRDADAGLPLLPNGHAYIKKVASERVNNGNEHKLVDLYFLYGLQFSPVVMWLNKDQSLFAVDEVIERGWEENGSRLTRVSDELLGKLDQEIAKKGTTIPESPVLLFNGRLVDVRKKQVRANMSVLIDGNRIIKVGADFAIEVPEKAQKINLGGSTILPGLWDMHVHIRSNTDGLLNIINGITSVRDMGGDVGTALARRHQFSTGDLVGPRLFLGGLIDGVAPTATSGLSVSSYSDLDRTITMLAENGYDQIKLYSSFPSELVPPAVALARKYGLLIGGHVPVNMRQDDVVKLGYDNISHFNFFMLNQFGDKVQSKTNTLARMLVPAGRGRDLDPSSSGVKRSIALLKKHNVALDPTMVVLEALFTAKEGRVSPAWQQYYNRLPFRIALAAKSGGLAQNDLELQQYTESFDLSLKLLGKAYEEGVKVLPGTDVLPGFEYVRELELYKDAGIPNLDVLRLATLGSAEHMQADTYVGAVEPGMLADIIIVDGRPDEDISALRNIRMVVKDGKFFDLTGLNEAVGVLPADNAVYLPVPATDKY
ncbi:amidohydrolase family protein [Kordiimonas pumila]|uniref:Amidohydrolase family protein n=1 Tax=Kordiimonas pumila TaxID=2161677 RepID=A0ABV7D3S3_9PROT|nr:amidohydrolase family protein [Kordiimonas pumila]